METQYSFAAREDDVWSVLMINGKDEDFKIVSDPSKLSDNVATTANESVTISGFSDVEMRLVSNGMIPDERAG
uniref:Uncharacterized protein n=1 Tax=Helianthus annuus TaxID=4232 RepID=A0A251S0N5_HELAN